MNPAPRPPSELGMTPLTSAGVQNALRLLLEGYEYAQDLQASPWEFAVDLTTLLSQGCMPNTLRWLVLRGYVEHAVPSPPLRGGKRHPRANMSRPFADGSSFVLTALGASAARSGALSFADPAPLNGQRHEVGETPVWDSAAGELRFRGQLVKRFRNLASNQQALLDAFQKAGWPPRLADPLPQAGERGVHVKQRLHDAIKNLNRGHLTRCLRFHGAGGGRAVGWKRLT